MAEFRKHISLETGVGQINASSLIHADDLTEDQISLKAIKFKPKLPEGMSVRNCTAILLVVEGLVEIQSLQFNISIASNALGSSCTGQNLDAQEWIEQGEMVIIGTEDSEGLMQRLPKLKSENIVVVDFTQHSLTVKLKELPKLRRPSFHFIIAENSDPELVEDSTWFAVDQNHDYLLKQ